MIGKRGCVIKDMESRCGVKISFPEAESSDETATLQTVVVKGDCNDDITEAIVRFLKIYSLILSFFFLLAVTPIELCMNIMELGLYYQEPYSFSGCTMIQMVVKPYCNLIGTEV